MNEWNYIASTCGFFFVAFIDETSFRHISSVENVLENLFLPKGFVRLVVDLVRF